MKKLLKTTMCTLALTAMLSTGFAENATCQEALNAKHYVAGAVQSGICLSVTMASVLNTNQAGNQPLSAFKMGVVFQNPLLCNPTIYKISMITCYKGKLTAKDQFGDIIYGNIAGKHLHFIRPNHDAFNTSTNVNITMS